MAQGKVWFITGASRGFGRVWTEAALERGDKVVATARKPEAPADLVGRYGDAVLALALDVTDAAAVSSTVQRGFEHFGRLDIVVSNAGYGQIGMIEETEIEAARRNFETNFFGTLSVIKAVLPLLRAQGSGHIIPVSSGVGLVSFPMGGIYGATKHAVNGLATHCPRKLLSSASKSPSSSLVLSLQVSAPTRSRRRRWENTMHCVPKCSPHMAKCSIPQPTRTPSRP